MSSDTSHYTLFTKNNHLNGASKVIQRAVGFEFEIPTIISFWNQDHLEESMGEFNTWMQPKDSKFPEFQNHETLVKCNGFEIQVDLSFGDHWPYMEIITSPFEDTSKGYDRLKNTINTIQKLALELKNYAKRHNSLAPISTIFQYCGEINKKYKDVIFRFTTLGLDALYSRVQATVGLRLDCIPSFFEDLSPPKKDEPEELLARKKEGRKFF